MAKHTVTATVDAPARDVFRRLNPVENISKTFSLIRDVVPIPDQTVAERRIAFRSTDGTLSGHITFEPEDERTTVLSVIVAYDPPAGAAGLLEENLGGGAHFEARLQHDLDEFAHLVEGRPAEGAQQAPEPSNFLADNDSLAPGVPPRELDEG